MLRHVLVELGKYTHSGTLIYWPWGSLRNRDDLGRIRIFPWIAGIPVDGPEARKLSCVRSVHFNCSNNLQLLCWVGRAHHNQPQRITVQGK